MRCEFGGIRLLLACLALCTSLSAFAQNDCELFNLQDLAAEILQLQDSLAEVSIETIALQANGSLEIELSNGNAFTLVLGCTDSNAANYNSDADTNDGSCNYCSSVTMDGHTYSVVQIGEQCWFAENLRTTVYANGTEVPEVSNNASWAGLSSGAHSAINVASYGRYYNFFAVTDPAGLCPTGWHVPADEEWANLADYISDQGFGDVKGTVLKSTTGWTNGTDEFGFSARSAGRRFNNGVFDWVGITGDFWSSTAGDGFGWFWYLTNHNPNLNRGVNNSNYGFSVRCLKGAE